MGLIISRGTSRTIDWYDIEFDLTASTPEAVRIGDVTMHQNQPIASLMRRCTLLDNGTVNYYLGASNSLKKENGTTDATLSGADGQFMVEIPLHYFREEITTTKVRWRFSLSWFPGAVTIPKHYVSAGEANLQRSTSKLSCLITTSTDYRGGDNTSGWDGGSYSLLGRPVTLISRTNFRTYAANRGSGWILENPIVYNAWRRLLYAEYGTRNIQQAYNATPTVGGYRQGGLGPGVTEATGWAANSYNPFIAIGVTASLGNATGYVSVSNAFGTHQVPSYRGIENPFGHIWKWLDGYNMNIQSAGGGGKSLLYYRNETTGLADDTATGYTLAGEMGRAPGYVNSMLPGHLFPTLAGGTGSGSTTLWCDYFYTDVVGASGWRAPLVGGAADAGANAGPVDVFTFNAASSASAYFGSRLCFLGA
ncbi:MAG: hypothetical protein WCK35_02850 [Chloroflexota bacterium]